jgi:hypothetical protein
MPIDDDRGSPWIKAEVTNNTFIRPKESYKMAASRSARDAQKRLDKQLNWLVRQVTKASKEG